MRPYRDVAALAGAQIACFLLLTHLEPNLFLIQIHLGTFVPNRPDVGGRCLTEYRTRALKFPEKS